MTLQSRKDSAIEAFANIAFGMLVAFLAQLIWFPMIGKEFTITDNVLTTCVFTAVSFARTYALRRWFNGRIYHDN